MKEDQVLEKIRQRMQASLIKAKEDELRDSYGMAFGFKDPALPPEIYKDWLDHILTFEKSWEAAPRITVFEKIGRPEIRPVDEIPVGGLEEAINDLLDRLLDHSVAVCFFGQGDERAAYRYLTEELLGCEIDDIHIEGMMACFDAATPAFDVEMWAEMFVRDILSQERERVLAGLVGRPLGEENGAPIPPDRFLEQLEGIWRRRPVIKRFDFTPLDTTVAEKTASVAARICWQEAGSARQIDASFHLAVSPFYGWDVVESTLVADLQALEG